VKRVFHFYQTKHTKTQGGRSHRRFTDHILKLYREHPAALHPLLPHPSIRKSIMKVGF